MWSTVHVGDDDGADPVRPDADRLEGAREPPRLAQGARGPGVDQDQAFAVVDEVRVEHEADAAGLGRRLRTGGVLDLLGGPAGEVGERHVGVPVRQGGDGEAADPEPGRRRQRRGAGGLPLSGGGAEGQGRCDRGGCRRKAEGEGAARPEWAMVRSFTGFDAVSAPAASTHAKPLRLFCSWDASSWRSGSDTRSVAI
jgi:hypothetical protein